MSVVGGAVWRAFCCRWRHDFTLCTARVILCEGDSTDDKSESRGGSCSTTVRETRMFLLFEQTRPDLPCIGQTSAIFCFVFMHINISFTQHASGIQAGTGSIGAYDVQPRLLGAGFLH